MLHHAWSPDSQWLAYTRNTPTFFNRSTSTRVADGKSHAAHRRPRRRREPGVRRRRQVPLLPGLDRRRPGQDWFAHGQRRHAGHAARLPRRARQGTCRRRSRRRATRRSGEEGRRRSRRREGRRQGRREGQTKPTRRRPRRSPPWSTIDLDGLEQRILALPLKAGRLLRPARPASAGQIFYLKARRRGLGRRREPRRCYALRPGEAQGGDARSRRPTPSRSPRDGKKRARCA